MKIKENLEDKLEKLKQTAKKSIRGGDSASALGVVKELCEIALTEYENARTDSLTGARNRRYHDERKTREISDPYAVLFIDIDNFKLYNEADGHHSKQGDVILKGVYEALSETVRSTDTITRWGGDEFAIILNDIKGEDYATKVAEKLRRVVEKMKIPKYRGVTISIGVASSDTFGTELSTLEVEADNALYEAKDKGRNRVVVAKKR